MGGRIVGRMGLVDAGGDHLAILDDDGAEGTAALADILPRQLDRRLEKAFRSVHVLIPS